MTIHHATLKRAEKLGVVLTEPREGVVLAHWPKHNQRLSRASAKEALDEMEATIELRQSFKSFKLAATDIDETGFAISLKGETIGQGATIRAAFDEARAAWKEMVADASEDGDDLDPNEAEEEEEEKTGSVVPLKYKLLYAERGDPRHCGDWLAENLNEECLDGDGKLIVDRLVEIAGANGVQCAHLANNQTNGWQGRMRMTTRNMLRGKVALSGTLVVPGGRDRTAPEDWCQRNMPKQKQPKKKAA